MEEKKDLPETLAEAATDVRSKPSPEPKEPLLKSEWVDRLCENCRKVREQIILQGKCQSTVKEDEEGEDGDENNKRPLLSGSELGLIKNLHRRSMGDINWQEESLFSPSNQALWPEEKCSCMPDSSWTDYTHVIRKAFKEGQEELTVAFKNMESDVHDAAKQAGNCIRCVIRKGWDVVSHWELPEWLRDNEFLSHGHRPQLPTFRQCFGSIFRIHTETGNIWTHLIGFILFVFTMLAVFARPHVSYAFQYPNGWTEYIVFGAFFTGAILCLLFSWLFHTVYCHSEKVHSIFSKLDYSGIAFLIMGSYVPCLYYGFYCKKNTQIAYLVTMSVFGVTCIIVSLWDKFGTPKYRPLRAGLFLCLGCSGFVPSIHLIIAHGFFKGVQQGALGWLLLMGALYIIGALLYAFRVPERFFPGKCNIWFQSHQIFHVLVVVAAFIHLYGICEMAYYRLKVGKSCPRV